MTKEIVCNTYDSLTLLIPHPYLDRQMVVERQFSEQFLFYLPPRLKESYLDFKYMYC